ncbi:hypothetical protein ACA910_006726 [Epithemia clementina (nom. ined.)]
MYHRERFASTLPFALFCSLLCISCGKAFVILPRQFGSKSSTCDWTSPSALSVSELHVPGYSQTKVPFILPEDKRIQASANDLFDKYRDFDAFVPHHDGHLVFKARQPILTSSECELIINEAEAVASEINWTKNRHGNFPTTDLPIVELPLSLDFIRHALVQRIYPMLSVQFGNILPDATKLRVADGFVVKYDAAGGQKELKPHRDGSVLSFNIALNPVTEYEGGGTWFSSLGDDCVVKIDQGEIVSHASALLHGGHGITSGRRYILVAFVILEGYDSWSMRFYNQVRNL